MSSRQRLLWKIMQVIKLWNCRLEILAPNPNSALSLTIAHVFTWAEEENALGAANKWTGTLASVVDPLAGI